jgi:hypothetical protein
VFLSGDSPECKEHYSEIGANATWRERRTVVDLMPPVIGQLQGSRMQISKSPSPRVETETGKGTDRESATDLKSETGQRIKNGRAERIAGTIDDDFVTGDSLSFCSEVPGVEVFCFVRWSVTLTVADFTIRSAEREIIQGCQ